MNERHAGHSRCGRPNDRVGYHLGLELRVLCKCWAFWVGARTGKCLVSNCMNDPVTGAKVLTDFGTLSSQNVKESGPARRTPEEHCSRLLGPDGCDGSYTDI